MLYRLRWIPLRLCCIILGLGLILGWGVPRVDVKVAEFRQAIQGDSVNQLAGRFYWPSLGQAPFPTVILCHGVSSHKETMTPLAIELVKHGIAAITFDFGGYGASYSRPMAQASNLDDVQSVLRWTKQNPLVDPARLGLAGHSMGGTTALETALADRRFKATVLLGIGGEATPSDPHNLMVGIGVYEQLNPVPEMTALVAPSIGPTHDFGNGTARSLVISPTADHAIAPYDSFLITKTIEWFQRAFSLTDRPVRVTYPFHLIGLGLCAIVSLGLTILAYRSLLFRYKSRLLLSIIASLLLVSFLGRWPLAGWLTLLLLPTVLVANYLHGSQTSFLRLLRQCSLYSLVLYVAYILGLVSHAGAVGSLTALPSAIFNLPILFIYTPFVVAYNQLYDCFYQLNRLDPLPVIQLSLGLVFAAEFYRQGLVLDQLRLMLNKLLRVVRQPIVLTLGSPAPSRSLLVILAALFVILLLLFMQRFQDGLLTGDAFMLVGRLLGFFVALPAISVVLVLRSSWFNSIEQRSGG